MYRPSILKDVYQIIVHCSKLIRSWLMSFKKELWYSVLNLNSTLLLFVGKMCSISAHSKPCTITHTMLLKCFVFQHNVIKTKQLRSLVRGVVRNFEWIEIMGFSIVLHDHLAMELLPCVNSRVQIWHVEIRNEKS